MNAVRIVAEMMAVAARTAPKTRGQDYLAIEIVEGEALRRLGEGMKAYGQRSGRSNFDRDGQNVLDSAAVVLVGMRDAAVAELNCGACGAETCIVPNTYDGEFKGPNCALRHLDMGIALGSAAKVASILNVDSRIMYRVGVVARHLGLIDADFVMGIPISATGKSIYFDRPS